MTGVSACSSDGESAEDYVAPLADTPGVDALAADDSVVPFGEWGVVRYENDGSTIFAIKLVGVVAGEPGDLGDVTVFGVDDLDSMTPYHVAYVWAPLSGDPAPQRNLGYLTTIIDARMASSSARSDSEVAGMCETSITSAL